MNFKSLLTIVVCSLLAVENVQGSTAKGKYGKIRWNLSEEGVLTLSGKGDIPDFNKASGEEPTVKDRPWSAYKEEITVLVVQKGVSRIGARSFQNFKNLGKVELHPGVKSVGKWAFQNCGALKEITISENTLVQTGAFRGTPVLQDVKTAEKTAYTESIYYRNLCEVPLTGNFREDMINIAKSQIGYHEGENEEDFDGSNPSSKDDFSEFGRYFDSAGSAWCSEFGSWCVRMSGLPENIFHGSRDATASRFTKDTPSSYYTWDKLCFGGGDYVPQAGDIVLWSWNLDEFKPTAHVSHTSIFDYAEVAGGRVTIHTVDGNSANKVRKVSYTVEEKDGLRTNGKGRVCFIVSPSYDDPSIEKHVVRFDFAGGSADRESKIVATGGLYGPLPVPKKSGAKFLGWFTEADGGTAVNIYTPVTCTSDHTIYARWK